MNILKNNSSKTDTFPSFFSNSIKEVVDFVRTSPFGISVILLGVYGYDMNHPSYFYELVGTDLLDKYIVKGLSLTLVSGGVFSVISQMKLRKRLERIISVKGYTDDVFKITLSEWCDRQTAMVVARNNDCLSEYVRLFELNKTLFPDLMSLKNLPHL
jgi:hypothetical protein